jgi:hypothetical protein
VDDSLEEIRIFSVLHRFPHTNPGCMVVPLRRVFRLPAEILVVEGWIGRDGVRAPAAEFEQSGYQYVVATGGSFEL